MARSMVAAPLAGRLTATHSHNEKQAASAMSKRASLRILEI